MEEGHGSTLNAALESISHDEIVALPQLIDEGLDGREIVTIIRVPHDDEGAAGVGDAAHECVAVALSVHVNHARSQAGSYGLRTVGTPVIGDDNLPGNPMLVQRCSRLRDARSQRLRFVETWQDERQLDW